MSRFERWKVRHRLKGCLINVTRLVFTLFLLLMAIGYAFSIIVLDINIVLILVLIVLIWFTPTIARYFENVQFKREGDKLEFSLAFAKLRDIEEKAEEANLLQTPKSSEGIEKFVAIAHINPASALMVLRTEVETRLREIIQATGLDHGTTIPFSKRASTVQMLRLLEQNQILTEQEASTLAELQKVLNQIVHAVEVPPQVVQWAVNTGPFILTALDKKIADLQGK